LVVVVSMFCLVFASPAWADIVMDGEFADWDEQAHITDPQGDTIIDYWDIADFAWANNADDDNLYFKFERYDGALSPTVDTTVFFDINDNGGYRDRGDCFAVVHYRPLNNNSKVDVEVFRYGRNSIPQFVSFYHGKWGESYREGALRWEFYVPMDDLGIQMGQSIRMYAVTMDLAGFMYDFDEGENGNDKDKYHDNNGHEYEHHDFDIIDRVPDQGDIQWSPIPILGQWGWLYLLFGGLVAAVFILWKRGKLWAG
ncbi:MAG: hypothetical protein ACM3NT_07680, partial [Methylocystaceae bacterium]